MTISKEERAEWRNEAKTKDATEHRDGIRLLIALNALESAETRVEEIEKRAKRLQAAFNAWEHGSDCGTCPLQSEPACDEICSSKANLISFCDEVRTHEKECQELVSGELSILIERHREMKTRAEAAERERDALAKVAADVACWNCPIGKQHKCLELPESDCSTMLLEWARQQARGGENA